MILTLKILLSTFLIFSSIFAALPGAFGLLNYKKKTTNRLLRLLATLLFHATWLIQVIALIHVWFFSYSIWWSIVLPPIALAVFFSTAGNDVSAG